MLLSTPLICHTQRIHVNPHTFLYIERTHITPTQRLHTYARYDNTRTRLGTHDDLATRITIWRYALDRLRTVCYRGVGTSNSICILDSTCKPKKKPPSSGRQMQRGIASRNTLGMYNVALSSNILYLPVLLVPLLRRYTSSLRSRAFGLLIYRATPANNTSCANFDPLPAAVPEST